MATAAECRKALEDLAAELVSDPEKSSKSAGLNRTLSCHITDLDMHFSARLAQGAVSKVREEPNPKAQIKIAVTSDDLLALTSGDLAFPQAWLTGRVKIDASVFDLLKLRSLL
jgi:putative sterol carrier protein